MRRLRRGLLAGAVLAPLLRHGVGHANPESAANAIGPVVPAAVARLLPQARLAGEGRLRWFGLPIYDARLFVGPDGLEGETYVRSAFALELRYARKLAGDEIAQASHKEIARLGHGSEAQRSAWLTAMRGLFPDVVPGDRLTGVHLPAEGRVVFLRNDTPIGRIEDRGFGEAFFGIWLDARTVAPDLRKALLQPATRDAAAGPGSLRR